jgi:hypothetical protein
VGVSALLIPFLIVGDPADAKLQALLQQYGASLLHEYRLPVPADVTDDWAWYAAERKASPYKITADFNGDGTPDYAFVLLGKRPFGVRIGALVSSGQTYRPFRLAEVDAGNEYSQRRYVVAVVPPGRYATLPGDDPAEIVLANAAIDLIYTESSDRFFYWDPKESRFRDVWITD